MLAALCLLGLVLSRYEIPRRQAVAAQQPADAMCGFARSFDFRRSDTLTIRAVYEELQPVVSFPIRASHRLVEHLQLDDEDLHFDYLPSIAQRMVKPFRTRMLQQIVAVAIIFLCLITLTYNISRPPREVLLRTQVRYIERWQAQTALPAMLS